MARGWRQFLNDADRYVTGHVYALEAKTVNDLFAEYERAYANMSIGLEAIFRQYSPGETWNVSDAQYRARTELLMDHIMREMRALSDKSQDMTLRAAVNSWQAGYLGKAWATDVVSGGGILAPLLPAEAVRAAIMKPYEGSTFVDRFKTNEADFQSRIRKSIVQSQIEGETIYQAQKRIANELGIAIDRRRKADRQAHKNDFNRTQMIARTEILRTSNLGSLAVYEQNKDVLKGWTWLATNDDRTCPICGELDGKTFEFGKGRNPPPAHPSCRCGTTPAFISPDKAQYTNPMPFKEWVAKRGIASNIYGQAYDLKAQKPPKSPSQAAKDAARERQ